MTCTITAIAKNTFKEGVRDRLFVAIGIFGLILLAASFIVGPLSLGEQVRITQDIGLASISILGFMVAVLIGAGIVYREVEKKTIYTVITKPVDRWKFIVGKFVGLNATVFLIVGGMTILLLIVDSAITHAFHTGLLIGALLAWIELVLLTALSILMSTLCSPILGAIFTFLLYVIGHTSGDLKQLAEHFGSPGIKLTTSLLYRAIPNLEYFNVRGKIIHGIPIDISYLAFAITYGLLFATIFLVIACAVFERKDFR